MSSLPLIIHQWPLPLAEVWAVQNGGASRVGLKVERAVFREDEVGVVIGFDVCECLIDHVFG